MDAETAAGQITTFAKRARAFCEVFGSLQWNMDAVDAAWRSGYLRADVDGSHSRIDDALTRLNALAAANASAAELEGAYLVVATAYAGLVRLIHDAYNKECPQALCVADWKSLTDVVSGVEDSLNELGAAFRSSGKAKAGPSRETRSAQRLCDDAYANWNEADLRAAVAAWKAAPNDQAHGRHAPSIRKMALMSAVEGAGSRDIGRIAGRATLAAFAKRLSPWTMTWTKRAPVDEDEAHMAAEEGSGYVHVHTGFRGVCPGCGNGSAYVFRPLDGDGRVLAGCKDCGLDRPRMMVVLGLVGEDGDDDASDAFAKEADENQFKAEAWELARLADERLTADGKPPLVLNRDGDPKWDAFKGLCYKCGVSGFAIRGWNDGAVWAGHTKKGGGCGLNTQQVRKDFGLAKEDAPLDPVYVKACSVRFDENMRDHAEGLAVALKEIGVSAWRWNTALHMPEFLDSEGVDAPVWRHDEGTARRKQHYSASLRSRIANRCQHLVKASNRQPEYRRLSYGVASWDEYILALTRDLMYCPFADYMTTLPEWDREPRLDGLLDRCFKVDTEPLGGGDLARAYVAWVSRYPFMAMVEQHEEPGAKNDLMPVLIGSPKGGEGKTTFVARILPPHLRMNFYGELEFHRDQKRMLEAVEGKRLIECGEMGGVHSVDGASMKRWMSQTIDNSVRKAYGHNAEAEPRVCVVVGTADTPGSALPDAANLRRFVALRISAGPDGPAGVCAVLDADRDQLFAEAKARYADGERVRVPDELLSVQEKANAQHKRMDGYTADLVDWLDRRGLGDPFTSQEAAEGIGMLRKIKSGDESAVMERLTTKPLSAQHALAHALRSLCYEKRRMQVCGVREYYWLPSGDDPSPRQAPEPPDDDAGYPGGEPGDDVPF